MIVMRIRGRMAEVFQKSGPWRRPGSCDKQTLPPLQQGCGMETTMGEPPPDVVQSPIPSRRVGLQHCNDTLPTHLRIGAETMVILRGVHQR